MTTQTTDHSLTFELVNDKAELEKALDVLIPAMDDDYYDWDAVPWRSIRTLLELVPRLMQSYEQLLETSYALADAWESYMNDQTPAGLYVPN